MNKEKTTEIGDVKRGSISIPHFTFSYIFLAVTDELVYELQQVPRAIESKITHEPLDETDGACLHDWVERTQWYACLNVGM